MSRSCFRLSLLAMGLATTSTAAALTLTESEQGALNLDLTLTGGLFHSDRTYDGFQGEGHSAAWREGWVQYGFSGFRLLPGGSRLEGVVNALYSGTWGDGDAAGNSRGDERQNDLEEAWLAWHAGDLLPGLGADGLTLAAGRRSVVIGDGFLIGGDMNSLGHTDWSRDLSRGGAYYLAGRTAFDRTLTLGLGGEQGLRGDLMWLRSDNLSQAQAEMSLLNLEYGGAAGRLGAMFLRVHDLDAESADLMDLTARQDLKVYNLRAQGNAGVEALWLSGEYVWQRDADDRMARAWTAEAGWTFLEEPWAPALSWRYSRFSEGYDPLFYGFTLGYGTWYQGEVASNYAGPWSSNNDVHRLSLVVTPREDLEIGLLAYRFRSLDRTDEDLSGQELDLYLSWAVNDWLTVEPLVGLYRPRRDADRGGLQQPDDGSNLYGQLVVTAAF